MILLNTSRLAKLLVDEAESAALRETLPNLARGEVLASSAVAVAELRAVSRSDSTSLQTERCRSSDRSRCCG